MYPALSLTLTVMVAPMAVYTFNILRRLLRAPDMSQVTTEWTQNFSAAKYQPMEGLLASDDFAFLSSQPGFDLSLYRKLRRERLAIFRQYLDCLIEDFNKLHARASTAIAGAKTDHSEYVGRVVNLRLTFALYVFQVEFSYLLCVCGLQTIHVRSLLLNLEQMNFEALQVDKPVTA